MAGARHMRPPTWRLARVAGNGVERACCLVGGGMEECKAGDAFGLLGAEML